jgi:hypothetical protein
VLIKTLKISKKLNFNIEKLKDRNTECLSGYFTTILLDECGNLNCTKYSTKGDFKLCSACKNVSYCSRKCSKIHWKNKHKVFCNAVCQIKNDYGHIFLTSFEENIIFNSWWRRWKHRLEEKLFEIKNYRYSSIGELYPVNP